MIDLTKLNIVCSVPTILRRKPSFIYFEKVFYQQFDLVKVTAAI